MRILAFGDSITQGFHDEERGGWCNRLITEVMKRELDSEYEYNRSVINLGISGDTSADVLQRVKAEIEARVLKYPVSNYDVLLLAIGVNDSQFTMDTKENKIVVTETEKNIRKTISVAEQFCEKVVIVGIAPVVDDRIQPMAWKPTHGYSNEVISLYNEKLSSIAREGGYVFIDLSDVYEGNVNDCLPDGIHPNAHGHRLIYERVKKALEVENIL